MAVESMMGYERGGRGGGDGGLIARLDERNNELTRRVADLEEDRDELIKITDSLREQQNRIVIIGSFVFAVAGVFGPTVINIIWHIGGK